MDNEYHRPKKQLCILRKCAQILKEKMMVNKMNIKRKIDFLNDAPLKVFLLSVLPLMVVAILSIFTQSFINDIYTMDIGDIIFTVTGIVGTITSLITNLVSSIVSSSWIKSSAYIVSDKKKFRTYFIQSLYALLIAFLLVSLVFIFFTDKILMLLNVPDEVIYETKQYLLYYVFSHIVLSVASYMLIIANGSGGFTRLFIGNTINSCGPLLSAFILIHCLHMGIIGAGLMTAANAVIVIAFCLVSIIKDKTITKSTKRELLPDFKTIWGILSYGFVLFIQSVFCTLGYLLVTAQANKYLSLDYLSVLGLNLPISAGMTSISTACQLFFAPNFSAGNSKRLKRFLFIATAICMVYGILCFAFYAIFGRAYYSLHFTSDTVIRLGTKYWLYYGTGYIFIPLLYTIRMFLETVGYGKVSLFAGVCECLGNIFCAYVLIPYFGNIGRSLSYSVGWALAGMYILIAYFICRKKIYAKCDKNKLELQKC